MADDKKNKASNRELEEQVDHYSSIEELLRKISAHQKEQYKLHKDINDQLNEIDELTEQAQDRWEEIEKTGDKFEKGISDKLLKSTGQILKVTTGTATSAKDYADQISNTIDHLRTALQDNKGNAIAQAMINKEIDKYNDKLSMAQEASSVQLLIAEQIKNANAAIADQADNILDGAFQQVDTHKILNSIKFDEIQLDNLREEKAKAIANRDADQVKLLGDLIKQKEEAIGKDKLAVANIEAQNKQWSAASSVIHDMGSGVTAIGNKITSAFEKVPGGAHIAKMLNIEGLAGNIQKKLGNALANVFQMGGKQAVAMGKLAAGALGIFGAIGGFLLHTLSHVDSEVSEIGKEFGISRKEADHLHHSAIELASEMQIVGINSKEIAKGIGLAQTMMNGLDIASAVHSGNKAVIQLVKDTTVLTEKFGLSTDEVKAIQDISVMTGKSMGQLTLEATTLGKGLMNSKESMKTLASIPKSVTVAFKGTTQELIKAAQKAKLIGMELGKVQDIGDGMLDIEQSLGKEMEARALTGKNLNLDAARMLALKGDTAGLQDELLRQAGSLEEYQDMNRIQQKAFADAMGMSVDEMTKMLTGAEEMNKLGFSSAYAAELQAMNQEQLATEMEKAHSADQKAYIQKLAKEKEAASVQERMSNIMTKLQEKLSAMVTPLLEVVHGLLDSVTAGDDLNGIIDGVVGAVKMIVPLIKFAAAGFGVLIGYVTPVFDIVKGIVEFMQKFTKGTGEAGDSIKPVEAGFGNVLALLTGISAVFFGKKALSKGMDILKDKAMDVGQTLMKKVTGPLGKVTDKLFSGKGKQDATSKVKTPKGGKAKGGGIGDKIADFVNKIDAKKLMMSAAAILILAAALWVAAKAFQEFSKVNWEGILKGVVGLLALVGVAFLIDKIKGQIIAGSVALLIMSAALLVMAIGFEKFGNMDWGAIAKGVVAIAAVAAVAVLLGMVAPLAIAGAVALMMLGAAVLMFGGGMSLFADAIVKIQPLIEGLFSQFNQLLSLDPSKLPAIALGIAAIAGALATLGGAAGAGGVAAGVGSAIAGLFGTEGPMEMVMNISKKLEPQRLSDTAKGIRELADAFKYFAEETSKLNDFDVDKLDTIISKMEDVKDAQSGGIGGAIMGAAKGIGGFLSSIISPQSDSVEGKPVVAPAAEGGNGDSDKLDKVIALLSQIAGSANQPTVIKFGDKTVEEIKGQLNFKKAYNIKVDNTFGRSV